MVFDKLKLSLLKRELKKAKESSIRETKKARARVAVIQKEEDKRKKILKEKLKLEAEKNKLRKKVKDAKKLNLTPSEKKLLMARMKAKQEKIDKLAKTSKAIGAGIAKTGLGILKFIAELDAELDQKQKKQKKKRTTKKKKK